MSGVALCPVFSGLWLQIIMFLSTARPRRVDGGDADPLQDSSYTCLPFCLIAQVVWLVVVLVGGQTHLIGIIFWIGSQNLCARKEDPICFKQN